MLRICGSVILCIQSLLQQLSLNNACLFACLMGFFWRCGSLLKQLIEVCTREFDSVTLRGKSRKILQSSPRSAKLVFVSSRQSEPSKGTPGRGSPDEDVLPLIQIWALLKTLLSLLMFPLSWYQHQWHMWVFIRDQMGRNLWKNICSETSPKMGLFYFVILHIHMIKESMDRTH